MMKYKNLMIDLGIAAVIITVGLLLFFHFNKSEKQPEQSNSNQIGTDLTNNFEAAGSSSQSRTDPATTRSWIVEQYKIQSNLLLESENSSALGVEYAKAKQEVEIAQKNVVNSPIAEGRYAVYTDSNARALEVANYKLSVVQSTYFADLSLKFKDLELRFCDLNPEISSDNRNFCHSLFQK